MAEEIELQTSEQQVADELEALRRTNVGLLEKKKKQSERITELEAMLSERDAEIARQTAKLKQVTVDVPMMAVAKDSSILPEIFLQEFRKDYTVEANAAGGLEVHSLENGKPVLDASGKPVSFEWSALRTLLLDEKNAKAETYRHLLIASKASGGNALQDRKPIMVPRPKLNFGLR